MNKIEAMTKDERSLLLFFESACVEYGGAFSPIHVSTDDFKIADGWKKSGFIDYGRISSEYFIKYPTTKNRYWVELSDDAWQLAHLERMARNKRIFSKREWKKTSELED